MNNLYNFNKQRVHKISADMHRVYLDNVGRDHAQQVTIYDSSPEVANMIGRLFTQASPLFEIAREMAALLEEPAIVRSEVERLIKRFRSIENAITVQPEESKYDAKTL